MKLGSPAHKTEFIDGLKKEYVENIWKNELHLLRLNNELHVMAEERERLSNQVAAKGKPAANAEQKQLFVLDRTIQHKKTEIRAVESTKAQNEYGLTTLLPQF